MSLFAVFISIVFRLIYIQKIMPYSYNLLKLNTFLGGMM